MQKVKKKEEVKKTELSIPSLRLAKATFPIIGSTPLLMDKMPAETLKEIEAKQSGQGRTGKKVRDIDREVEEAVHYLPDGSVGYPAAGFKAGMIESTSFIGDKSFSKKLIRGIKILNAVDGIILINHKKRDVLIHNVGSNTKHTPQFHNWSCDLEIQFDMNNVSEKDIAALINYAGFYYGIGIWSPRCKSGGDFGMYKLKEKNEN